MLTIDNLIEGKSINKAVRDLDMDINKKLDLLNSRKQPGGVNPKAQAARKAILDNNKKLNDLQKNINADPLYQKFLSKNLEGIKDFDLTELQQGFKKIQEYEKV